MLSHRDILYIVGLILIQLCSNATFGQRKIAKTADFYSLHTYADSLENLLLGHRTTQTLAISDSLLTIHGKVISPEVIRIKAARANAYELRYSFEDALEIYNDLIAELESHQFVYEEIALYLSLARVYESIGKPELCQQSLDRALTLIEEYDQPQHLSRYYVRSSSYQRIYGDNRDLAREYAIKGVMLGRQDKVERSVADGSLLLGILSEDIDESIKHFQAASHGFTALGDNIGAKFQDLNRAKKYLEKDDTDTALGIIEHVERYVSTIDDNVRVFYQFKIRTAQVSEMAYQQLGWSDSIVSALRQNNRYSRLFGDFVNQEKIEQLIFDNQLRLEQQKVASAERTNQLLGLGILSLLGIIGFLVALYIKNRRQKVEITQQATLLDKEHQKTEKMYRYQSTLLSEVHHRIKNNLQLIISLLTLQKAKATNSKDVDLLDMLNNRVASISLIHEQLYKTKEFDKVDLEKYVIDLVNNLKNLLLDRNLEIEHDVQDIALNLETTTPLGLIWSELISNSVKYNKDKPDLKIKLKLEQKCDHLEMHYQDNGQGYPDGTLKPKSAGMGYIIINSLSKQLAAQTFSYNEEGANYKMTFREKEISPL